MKYIYKRTGLNAVIAFITILFSSFSQIPVYAAQPLGHKPTHPFHISVKTESDTITLAGESEFLATPSSYSLNMKEDNGRCVIHMLNFNTPPGPGTYRVDDTELVRLAMVCVLEKAEPNERLASHSGTFTITEIGPEYIEGHFDMILKGPLSGKEFHFTGKVRSENQPSPLIFNQK